MYRRGPSKSTPSNVQCQKCLKRGHYSYECKATTQERPYVPRPSRTQQLLNPKLAPKLTETAPVDLQKKQGVADQELAKREAERAKKRELERDGEESEHEGVPKRRRSVSYDSVSTISTRGSPTSPAGRRLSRSPSPGRRSPPRSGNYSASDYRRDRDVHSPGQVYRSSRSPNRGGRYPQDDENADLDSDYHDTRPRRYYSSVSRSRSRSPAPTNQQRRFRTRSPRPERRRHDDSPPRYNARRRLQESPQHRRFDDGPRGQPSRRERERSLSPFSKRLALTQVMNSGR